MSKKDNVNNKAAVSRSRAITCSTRRDLAFLRELAENLADAYKRHPVAVAEICDEVLDRTGALLGFVRDAARNK